VIPIYIAFVNAGLLATLSGASGSITIAAPSPGADDSD
jgi:hypothetical protein